MTGRSVLDRHTLADLRARLARARPEAIRDVVALIDRLPDRGEADALIAPMRPRLSAMRDLIRRPASFGRVLAHPVEDLLVPPEVWRRGSLSLPRSIMPIAITLAVEAMAADLRRSLQERLDKATMDDSAAVQEAGAAIWPVARARFAELAADGLPSGLALPMRAADLRVLLGAFGETLRLAEPLASLMATAPRGTAPGWERIEPGLRAVAAEAAVLSGDCFGRAGLVLMRRFMVAGPVIGVLRDAAGRAGAGEAERRLAAAIDTFLAELPAQLPDPAALSLLPHTIQQASVAEAVATVERAGTEIGAAVGERRDRLREAQGKLMALLRRRVPECLSAELLAPLARLHAGGLAEAGGPAGLEGLETAARAAAAMVASGRRLGPVDDLALGLKRAADTVAALAASAPHGAPAERLGRNDLARLVEILAGPDAALRILGPAG